MKKGLIVFSNNVEDAEAIFTRDLLLRAGLEIDTVSVYEKEIRTAYNIILKTDYLLSEISLNEYDFLIISGGKYVGEIINIDDTIKRIILEFSSSKKMIAAICAAPRFLGQLGLLIDKNFTCFPGAEIDMPNGNYLKELKAVRDQNIITARSVAAVIDFCIEIIKYQLSELEAKKLLEEIVY